MNPLKKLFSARDVTGSSRGHSSSVSGDPGRPSALAAAPALPACLRDIAWCDVQAGSFEWGGQNGPSETRTVDPAIRIAKYPVTYEQFQAFIDAPDGYCNADWWRGLHADGRMQQRGGPGKQKWPIANHPREIVSWYDAMAFCCWLSRHLGYVVTLPTEEQWEKAARGPNGQVYPYGDKFNKRLCNISESGIGRTTPVDKYKAPSWHGAMDMCGNVWEWTLTEFSTGNSSNVGSDERRAVRGGSWNRFEYASRAASRDDLGPDFRRDYVGFRLASPG
jgi:formylglycine-generating enzyme required for sulfatase activity